MALERMLASAIQRAGAVVDRGALRMMERAMARGTLPPPDARRQMLDVAARYQALGDRFLAAPEPAVVERRPIAPRAGAREVLDLRFSSPYRPALREFVDEYASYDANLTVHARLYRAGGDGRPVAICLHGWGGGAYWLEERAFAIAYWLRLGLDVVLFQLPYHGLRAPRQGRRSGALFPSPHVVRTNEAFGQAIADLRALMVHLRHRGAADIGVMGMSLGGYTTALLATVEDLAFAIPMIPAVDMAALMWRHGSDSPHRRRAEALGIDGELLAKVFRVHSPLARAPRLAPARRMIVAGRGDCITGPEQAQLLWEHWARPAMHWFPGGHLAQVGRGDAFRAVRKHLQGAGLI